MERHRKTEIEEVIVLGIMVVFHTTQRRLTTTEDYNCRATHSRRRQQTLVA